MAGSLERLPRAAVGTGLSFRFADDGFRTGVDIPELCVVVSPLILNDVVALLSFDIAVNFPASAVGEVPSLHEETSTQARTLTADNL